MERFLPDGRGSDRATRWKMATGTIPFAPQALDRKLIQAHARLVGGPIGVVADLDPHGLHAFGALRSGDVDAPVILGRGLAIEWLGIEDAWLRRVGKTGRPLAMRTIRMRWVEREYWDIVKRFAPGVPALIGGESLALLESGYKAESDAFQDVMPAMLRARLRRARRRAAHIRIV
jgi:hypothetical protein